MRDEFDNIDRSQWAAPKKAEHEHVERVTTSISGVPAAPTDLPPDTPSDAPTAEDLMNAPMLGPSTTPITLPITVEEEKRLEAAGKPRPKNLFGFLNRVDARVVLLLGSLAVGLNPVFVKLAGENAATAVFFRFAIALIPLGIFAILELRLNGRMRAKDVLLHLTAGAFFGLDVGLWIPGVLLAGAGIATVAGNLQVIIVPLLALLIFREKLTAPFLIAIPVMLGGVVLLSGVIETGLGGDAFIGVLLAVAGGIAYAGYIMIIGRARPTGHASTNVFLSSFSSMIVGTAVTWGWGAPNFTPDWQPLIMLILMAVFSQVIGWVATASALPRLDSATGSMLLLAQPLVAIVGGVVLIGEHISLLQWIGIVAIIVAVWFTSFMSGRMRRKRAFPE